jgi:hypothetical protein
MTVRGSCHCMVAINLRCAEGVDMSAVEIQQFDGANML